jgi:hypothetical protein
MVDVLAARVPAFASAVCGSMLVLVTDPGGG